MRLLEAREIVGTFQVPWAFGARLLDEAVEMAKRFDLSEVTGRIECPMLVVHGENDRVVPLDSALRLYEAVGTKRKTLKIFTMAEAGAEHVQVDNRQGLESTTLPTESRTTW